MFIVVLCIIALVIVLIVLALWNMLYPRPSKDPFAISEICEKGHKTAVVIGGTSRLGIRVVNALSDKGYQVIVGSRRISRFLDCELGWDSYSGRKLSWIYMDTRVFTSLEDAFTQISNKCGQIDVVVNLACITGGNYQLHAIRGERNGDDIYLKLMGAYTPDYKGNKHLYRRESPGIESWLFTNVIGLINVAEMCSSFDVHRLVLIDSPNRIVQGVIEEIRTKLSNDRLTVTLTENVHEVVI